MPTWVQALALLSLGACSSTPRPLPAGTGGQGGAAPVGGAAGGTWAASAGGTGGQPLAAGSGGAGAAGASPIAGGGGAGAMPPASSACALEDPFLKANGIHVRNNRGTGDVIALRGANLGGWLLVESWMTPVAGVSDDFSMHEVLTSRFGEQTKNALVSSYQQAWMQAADWDSLAALGMNVVRVPISHTSMQHADGSLRADAFERLDWAIEEAWKRCIYVIIDMHGAWGGANPWGSSGNEAGGASLFTNEDNRLKTQALWEAVAARYSGNPAVAAYDLLNEPMGIEGVTTNQERWELQDRFLQAIRAVDPDHMIYVEAIWWLDDLPEPSTYGWTNVAYQCHHYDWDAGEQGDVQALKQGADDKVNDFVSHAAWGVPLLIGEFNFFGQEQAWAYGVERWDEADLSWTTWSYRSNASGGGVTNSWGLVNPSEPRPAVANVTSDSSSDIESKWSQWTADKFVVNPMLQRTLAMPRVALDAYSAVAGQPLVTAAPGVLANDDHANAGEPGVALSVELVTGPAHGALELAADGGFTYTPNPGFSGSDGFSYRVFDGRVRSPAPGVVRITVE